MNPGGSSTITVVGYYTTGGPQRPGFLQFSDFGLGQNDSIAGGTAGFLASTPDGPVASAGCGGGNICKPTSGTVPITLGTVLELQVSAFASIFPSGLNGSGTIQASFQVFEYVPGTGPGGVVQQFDTLLVATPEPDTALPTLAGLLLLVWISRGRDALAFRGLR
jgi:hypothetical protein